MAHLINVRPTKLAFGIAAIVMIVLLAACTVTYQFAPIGATVVDAETGKPLEGVVVTANWELVKGSLDGPRYFGQLDVKETVTDKDGRFTFAGFTKEDSSGAELRESDPQILVFKAGYEFQRFTNDYRDGGAGMKLLARTAAVNGKTVKLVRQKQDADKEGLYTSHSRLVSTRLGFIEKIMPHINETENCYWQAIPRMILESRRQETYMRSIGINPPSLSDYLIKSSDNLVSKAKRPCKAPKELFLEK